MEKGNKFLHFMDRYLGIPIIFFLGIFKIYKNPIPKKINRIGIIKTASIGDTVLMSSVIKDLRKNFPEAEIIFFIAATNYELALMRKGYNKLIKLNVKSIFKSIYNIRKEGQFDVFIDYGAWPRLDAFFSFFAIAKYKLGFYAPGQFKHFIYDKTAVMSNSMHEIENFRSLTRLIANKCDSLPSLIVKHNLDLSRFNLLPKKYIILHPWPSGYKSYLKEWPLESWKLLFDKINQNEYKFVITGSKSDFVKSNILIKKLDGVNVISLAGKLSLTETLALLKSAKLVISVNTGIMHAAAAINSPLIALHGPTNVNRWGPISDNHINIVPKDSKCGYLNLGFEYPNNPPKCMEMISADEVNEAVQTFI